MADAKLRILLADDHALVREGLRSIINDQPDMQVVGEAGDGPEAVRLCQSVRPDIALIDVSMPGWDGVTTTEMLRPACPQMKIISVTRHDDESFMRRMLAAGAAGYVLKQSSSGHLTDAIRAVSRGEQYIDQAVRRMPVQSVVEQTSAVTRHEDASGDPLSAIEEQVLRLVASSRSNQEIAARFAVHVDAVGEIKARAMAKLGLRTRLQVIDYAHRSGWFAAG